MFMFLFKGHEEEKIHKVSFFFVVSVSVSHKLSFNKKIIKITKINVAEKLRLKIQYEVNL